MRKHKKNHVKTGGTYIGGNVDTGGGKFVGRDDYSGTNLRNKSKRKTNMQQKTKFSIIKALMVGSAIIVTFELVIYRLPWTWLITHPNSLALQIASDILLLLITCALFLAEWRKYIISSMLIPIFGFLLTLLKDSNKP